jgi:hypothetical protein
MFQNELLLLFNRRNRRTLMAFSDFKYPEVLRKLKLADRSDCNLYGVVPSVPVSSSLREILKVNVPLATTAHSEASRSTWLVGPLLGELWVRHNGRFNMFAGIEFSADPEAGLNGYCDFIIGRTPQLPVLQLPVIVIFQAKRDSIADSLGQCIAGMEGIMRYNRRHGTPFDPIYGVVTTGSLWKFLQLSNSVVTIDLAEYTIAQVDKLFGIFMHMIGLLEAAA